MDKKTINCRFFLSDGFPWKGKYGYGYGRIKPANIDAVLEDTLESSLLLGPKLARLLAGKSVSEGAYNQTVNFKPDPRDPRFIEHINYGSVATWQCTASKSIEARARYIKSKLKEVDVQLKSSPLGIVHIAMDAERDKETADLRRSRNMDVFLQFKFESNLVAGCLHYFVSRVTEVSAWMIDETPDRFGRGDLAIAWPGRIFDQAEVLDNDLAAWHQRMPNA